MCVCVCVCVYNKQWQATTVNSYSNIIIGLKYATFEKKETNLVVSYSTTGCVFYLHTSLHCLTGLMSKVTVIISATLNKRKLHIAEHSRKHCRV